MRGTACLAAVAAVLAAISGGCTNEVQPYSAHYSFFADDARLSRACTPTQTGNSGSTITAEFTCPAGKEIRFLSSLTALIEGPQVPTELKFSAGVYPLTLHAPGSRTPELCGAMLVTNVNEVVALATFGKSEDTPLLSQEFVEKARAGALTFYTVTFDDEPVIYYWLGNRKAPSPPGRETVEMNFAGTNGLREIRIDGSVVRNNLVVLDCFQYQKSPQGQGLIRNGLTHKMEITRDNGRQYVGYVRKLVHSPFTAFVQLPCAIPDNLFDAADGGTIAKYSVYSDEMKQIPVAEIVFGEKK